MADPPTTGRVSPMFKAADTRLNGLKAALIHSVGKEADARYRSSLGSWKLWAIAVSCIGVLTGAPVLALASSQLEQPALRVFLIGWLVSPYLLGGLWSGGDGRRVGSAR
jgi:hypothetical protein